MLRGHKRGWEMWSPARQLSVQEKGGKMHILFFFLFFKGHLRVCHSTKLSLHREGKEVGIYIIDEFIDGKAGNWNTSFLRASDFWEIGNRVFLLVNFTCINPVVVLAGLENFFLTYTKISFLSFWVVGPWELVLLQNEVIWRPRLHLELLLRSRIPLTQNSVPYTVQDLVALSFRDVVLVCRVESGLSSLSCLWGSLRMGHRRVREGRASRFLRRMWCLLLTPQWSELSQMAKPRCKWCWEVICPADTQGGRKEGVED